MEDIKPEQEVKRSGRKKIFLWIAIILIIHLLLTIINVSIPIKEQYTENVPYESIETYVSKEQAEKCENIPYNWTHQWEEWQPEVNGYISPTTRLTNLENRGGVFTVYFAFFDESIYKYNAYKDRIHTRVKDKLPWEAASMFSQKITLNLNPYEDEIITIYTKKEYPNGIYWAYTDVEAPNYTICESGDYQDILRNRNITKYRTENKTKTRIEHISMLEYLLSLI